MDNFQETIDSHEFVFVCLYKSKDTKQASLTEILREEIRLAHKYIESKKKTKGKILFSEIDVSDDTTLMEKYEKGFTPSYLFFIDGVYYTYDTSPDEA